jgi:hypothetical protein
MLTRHGTLTVIVTDHVILLEEFPRSHRTFMALIGDDIKLTGGRGPLDSTGNEMSHRPQVSGLQL